MGGFTGALQAAHQKNGGQFGRKTNSDILGTHQSRQFIVDNFNNLLRGGQTFKHLCADSLFRNSGDKIFCHLVVDVGLKQCQTHLAHNLFDIRFLELAAGSQPFKNGIQLIGKSFKSHASPP
ncbi:hypothetical protein SDC9_195894 [bioreactor metagenome]|uniref:Uncharacterized protein n=1 Tax=bioreactor metagenome TaxID=1076179 RepID=A0A645IAD4_9ZZZZ